MAEPTREQLIDIIDQIAREWDGCEYDAPGENIDIGNAIRTAGYRRIHRLFDASGVMVSDEAQRREVWLRACGAFCAPDGTCSCAKFADDPTKCERKKEMERAYGVKGVGDDR